MKNWITSHDRVVVACCRLQKAFYTQNLSRHSRNWQLTELILLRDSLVWLWYLSPQAYSATDNTRTPRDCKTSIRGVHIPLYIYSYFIYIILPTHEPVAKDSLSSTHLIAIICFFSLSILQVFHHLKNKNFISFVNLVFEEIYFLNTHAAVYYFFLLFKGSNYS